MKTTGESALFMEFSSQPHGRWESLRCRIRENRAAVIVAAAATMGIHAAVFGFFASIPDPLREAPARMNAASFPARNPDSPSPGQRFSPPRERSEGEVPRRETAALFDRRESQVKSGPDSPPVPAAGDRSYSTDGFERSSDVIKRAESLRRNRRLAGSRQVRVATERGDRFVPSEYFFRTSPFRELSGEGGGLFYILDGFPSLSGEKSRPPTPPEAMRSVRRKERRFSPGNDFRVERIAGTGFVKDTEWAAVPERSGRAVPPGPVDPLGGEVLNELMLLPEVEQFRLFRRRFLDDADPNDRELADFSTRFIRHNLSSSFVVVSDVSAAFDFVEEVHFNKALDREFAEYWRSRPGSRTGAAFLLALASHYEFERRALVKLFKAAAPAEAFLRRRSKTSEIHDKREKSAVIRKVHDKLVRGLEKRGFRSFEEVARRYREEEEKIYRRLIEMGGEERAAGLYALGNLSWESRRFEEALDLWGRIAADYADNPALQEIRYLRVRHEEIEDLVPRIDAVLFYHAHRSAVDLLLRLVTFGRWNIRSRK